MRCIATVLMASGIVGLVLFAGSGAKSVQRPALDPNLPIAELAVLAISEDENISSLAIQRLRDAGQAGLDALFSGHPEIARRAVTHARCEQPETNRWRCAVDAVARQRDAAFSRLYWHTDLEQAKAIAAEQNKPILSLRLLGELHEEYSCANSRYFRTVLYADPLVADSLRDSFVLHWKSVRPVPRITIDMGDGRRIDRTITGNSVHYVLNSDGRVLDVIPGLWDAEAFREVLDAAHRGNRTGGALFGEPGASTPANVLVNNAPPFDLSKGLPERPMLGEVRGGGGRSPARVTDPADEPGKANPESDDPETLAQSNEFPTLRINALEAGEVARSKFAVEVRMLEHTHRLEEFYNGPASEPSTSERQSVSVSRLSSASQRLMWQKRFAADADPYNPEQQLVMQAMIATFQRTVAEDTALNRDLRRLRALRWLEDPNLAGDVEKFNERVYAELFLSPLDDPWMGLVPDDAYAGLANEGLVVP